MIGNGEGSMIGLSLELPLGYTLEYPNTIDDLPGILLRDSLGLWFDSGSVRCLCCYRRLMDGHEPTCWGVGIYSFLSSGSLITSIMNSVRYCQLLDFLTLALSPTCLIAFFLGGQKTAELSSSGSMLFTLGMDEDSSRLTDELSS